MTMLWVNEAIERLPPLGYRTRIIACAAAAAGIPLLLLLSEGRIGLAIAAGVAALWFVFCTQRLLLPLRDLASALDACAGAMPARTADAPRELDEIERMIAATDRISDLLQAAMSRELGAVMAGGETSSLVQNPRSALANKKSA